jgi:hypothetical protein
MKMLAREGISLIHYSAFQVVELSCMASRGKGSQDKLPLH